AQRTRSGSLCIIEAILERLVKLIVFDDFNGGIIRILSLTLAGNGFLGAWGLTFLLAPGALCRLKWRGRAKSRPYIRLLRLLFARGVGGRAKSRPYRSSASRAA